VTRVRNNFDGGPDGVKVTAANSGQVPGNDAFQAVSPATTGTMHYRDASTLGRGTAEFVLHTATTATATSVGVGWTTAIGTQSQVWLREYVYFTALPVTTGMAGDMYIFGCDNTVAYGGHITLGRTDGKLRLENGPQTLEVATTSAVPLNQWLRVEARLLFSTTVGTVELQVYEEPDSDEPSDQVSASGWNMGVANANTFYFGSPFNDYFKPNTYFSGIELNNEGWPGPAPFRQKAMPGYQPSTIAIHPVM
jgi:hypothetical protein